MKKRIRQTAAAVLTTLMLGNVLSIPAWAEEASASYDLMDNLIEFEEVGALVENYSVIGKLQSSLIDNTASAMETAREEMENSRKDMQDEISDVIEDLRSSLSDTTRSEERKQIQAEINGLKRLRNSSRVYLSPFDSGFSVNVGLTSYRESAKALKNQEKMAVNAIKSQLYTQKKLMTNGMQELLFSYKQMELTEKLLIKQVEMYQQMLAKRQKMQSLGSGTAMETRASQIDLLGAENNLSQLRNGKDRMKRVLGTSLGWSMESYTGIELGNLPEYDIHYMDGRVFEVDVESAKQQNADWGQVLRMSDKDITGWDERDILLKSTDQQILVAMTALRNQVLQKKEEYESASTSAELARLKKEKAERMDAVGLLGNADYDGLQLDYINKENAAEQAKMNFNQAVFRYEQAVHKGILTLEE